MDGKKIIKATLVVGGLITSSAFSYGLGTIFHDMLLDERINTLKPERLMGKIVFLWSEVVHENHDKYVQDTLNLVK